MKYILLSIFIIIASSALYILLFRCYSYKKIDKEKIKLVRTRIFV